MGEGARVFNSPDWHGEGSEGGYSSDLWEYFSESYDSGMQNGAICDLFLMGSITGYIGLSQI